MHLLLLVVGSDHCEVWGLASVDSSTPRMHLHHLEALGLELRLAHGCGSLGGATGEPYWLHRCSVHMDRVSHFKALRRQLRGSSCFLGRYKLNHLAGANSIHLCREYVDWRGIRPKVCSRKIYFVISV